MSTEATRLLGAKIPGPETGIEVKKSICTICDPGTQCGLDLYVKDGHIVKVQGSGENPHSGGTLCSKGAATRQYVYHRDRLRPAPPGGTTGLHRVPTHFLGRGSRHHRRPVVRHQQTRRPHAQRLAGGPPDERRAELPGGLRVGGSYRELRRARRQFRRTAQLAVRGWRFYHPRARVLSPPPRRPNGAPHRPRPLPALERAGGRSAGHALAAPDPLRPPLPPEGGSLLRPQLPHVARPGPHGVGPAEARLRGGRRSLHDRQLPVRRHRAARLVELVSNLMARFAGSHGYDALPTYRPPRHSAAATPDLAADFPLVLNTGSRLPMFIHSRTFRLRWTRALRPEPAADLSPADAARLGIVTGDAINLSTPKGTIEVKANVTATVQPGVVHMYHAYPEADVNGLMEADYLDPISGFPGFKGLLCRVQRVVA